MKVEELAKIREIHSVGPQHAHMDGPCNMASVSCALNLVLNETERLHLLNLKRALITWDKEAADKLADEVAVLVKKHILDSRSPAADALLDYREPPTSPRADRIVVLEQEIERLRKLVQKAHALGIRLGDYE